MLKNVNLATKPQISISLVPVLEAFCRYIFKTPANVITSDLPVR